jgi:chromosome segregation ATPase
MSRETLVRLGRRTVVAAVTVAVLGVAVGTVQLAAQWRADAAPLDAAPVSMGSISRDYTAENDRVANLAGQLSGVAQQISGLQAALITANGSVAGDATNAQKLQGQLDAAKNKLKSIQRQLKAAQGRLSQLNQAASRQAALNRAAGAKSTTKTSKTKAKAKATATPTASPRHDDDD